MKISLSLLVLAASSGIASERASDVDRYLDYRALTRITTEKIDVAESVRTLCWDPRLAHGPHLNPGLHIYVNDVVLNALEAQTASPAFPIGTLIVKEKFENRQDAEPSLITVMEKRTDTGTINDWHFVMIRVRERSVVREAFEVSCTECHSRFQQTGFVSHTTASLLLKFTEAGNRPIKALDPTPGNAPRHSGGPSED